MKAPLAFLLVTIALLLARPAAAEPTARFALVIGNNQPENAGDERLRYADDDAVATHRLLLDAGVHSVLLAELDAETRTLAGVLRPFGAPTTSDLERSFSDLAARIRQANRRGLSTEFLFFFSGHGDVDGGEGYVVLKGTRFTRSALYRLLSRSGAKRNHVVVDACKSYYLVFDRGPGGRRSSHSGAGLIEAVPASLANTGFVLSSASDRDSHEWERYQGGILSHELRSALRGAADADSNGRISYAELGAFLTTANAAIENRKFRPEFVVRPPDGSLSRTVLEWQNGHPSARLNSEGWGHFYVENARGQRLLDAHPARGQPLLLWLPEERPLYVRRNDERGELVVTAQGAGTIGGPAKAAPELARRGALNRALEQLFSTPFDRGRVQLFEQANEVRDELPPERVVSTDLRHVRKAAAVSAIAAAGVGLTLSGVSAMTQYGARDGSQREAAEANERSRDLNRASIPAYSAAALGGAVWALTWLFSDPPVSINAAIVPRERGVPSELVIEGRF